MKRKKIFFIFEKRMISFGFLFLLSSLALGEGELSKRRESGGRVENEREPEPKISKKWFQGNYLIYDCEKGHFACVNELSFEKCREERSHDFDQLRYHLRCAPFIAFKTQTECFLEQYHQLENKKPPLYCLGID